MVNLTSEQRYSAFQSTLDRARKDIGKGNYTGALNNLILARGMVPQRYKTKDPKEAGKYNTDIFGDAYRSGISEIGSMLPMVREGVEQKLGEAYSKVNDAFRRIETMKEVPNLNGTNVKKRIKRMEGYVNGFVQPHLPAQISAPARVHQRSIQKLKKQLEGYASSRGQTIDWNAA